jgi:chemotaxis protein CheZ
MEVDDNEKLLREVGNLVNYTNRLRQEIAGIVRRKDDQTAFESMSSQLDEIVSATSNATHTILESIETIESAADHLRMHPDDEGVDEQCERISAMTMQAMEACSFQDITGQRVTKIVSSLRFIEEHVDAMAEIWGKEAIDSLSSELAPVEEKGDDGVPLEGPAMPGEAISQADIDALFD